MKHCKTCQRDLPDEAFRAKTDRHGKPRLYSKCKECSRAYARQYQQRNPPALRRYGLSREQLEQLGDHCEICGASRQETRLCVDHCHETRKVRGVLCHNCNVALGHFGDNVTKLEQAILYLREKQ